MARAVEEAAHRRGGGTLAIRRHVGEKERGRRLRACTSNYGRTRGEESTEKDLDSAVDPTVMGSGEGILGSQQICWV